MALRTNAAPYLRSKNSTLKIMLTLTIALCIVWILAIAYSFKMDAALKESIKILNDEALQYNETFKVAISNGLKEAKELITFKPMYGLRTILVVLVSLVTTAICDILNTTLRYKKGGSTTLFASIKHDLVYNYSYVTALIFALTLPAYISYYVVIIGSIFATVVVKNLFGGFGKNIFNPAAMARILVGICFTSQFDVPSMIVTLSANASSIIDATTGATLTTAFNNTMHWLGTSYSNGTSTVFNSIFNGYSMLDILFGNYLGSMGETFTIAILVIGIVLSILKVINWRTPVFYVSTVAITAFVIALILGLDNPFSFVLYHLSLGGLMFGAVFMLTDPVTGPTSSFGKILVAIFAGFMTMLIRIKGSYPEGVVYSIALANILSCAIDYVVVGKSNDKLVLKYVSLAALLVLSCITNSAVAYKVNGGKTIYYVNGIDKVQYDILSSSLTLKENDTYKPIENYEVKTDKAHISGYEYAKDKLSFAPAYEIVDGNKEKVGMAYLVSSSGSIDISGYKSEVTFTLIVAISNDGTIYGVGNLTDLTYKYGSVNSKVVDYAQNAYLGKDNSNYLTVDAFTSASYSSSIIKQAIGYAFAEFEQGGK